MLISIRTLMLNDLLTTQRLQFSTIVIADRVGGEDEDNSRGVGIDLDPERCISLTPGHIY